MHYTIRCSIKKFKHLLVNSSARERGREMFYLTTHSTHFIYGYMASDIWLRTILIVRKETRCRHIGYSYRLAARVLLYAPSHRQDSTYHGLCYTSRGALAGMRKFISSLKTCRFTTVIIYLARLHFIYIFIVCVWVGFFPLLFSI